MWAQWWWCRGWCCCCCCLGRLSYVAAGGHWPTTAAATLRCDRSADPPRCSSSSAGRLVSVSLSLSAYGTPTLHEHSHPRTRTPATSTSQRVIGDGLPSCYERCSDGVEVTKELKKRSWGVRQESLVSSVVVAVSRAIERLSFQRVQLSAAAGRAVLSRSGLPLPEQ